MVGLRQGHGWQRGDWILFDHEGIAGTAEPDVASLALGTVTDVEERSVRVHIVCRKPGVSLTSTLARHATPEQARLGKCTGRVVELRGDIVQLDLGSGSAVAAGDEYDVLDSPSGAVLARVRVTGVGRDACFARRIMSFGPLRTGLTAVQVSGSASSRAESHVVLLLVDFAPAQQESPKRGRWMAKDLANDLAEMTGPLTSTRPQYSGPSAGRLDDEAAVYDFGRSRGADVVVWGTFRGNDPLQAEPRVTFVSPRACSTPSTKSTRVGKFAVSADSMVGRRAVAEAVLAVATCSSDRR